MTALDTTVRGGGLGGRVTGTIAAAVTLLLLCGATLAWGAVAPETHAALTAVLCAVGCAGLAVMMFRDRTIRLPPGAVPLLLFVLLVFLQTLPFGIGLSAQVREVTGLSGSQTLSLVPAATVSGARGVTALFVLFALGAYVFGTPQRMRQLPWTLLQIAAVVAVYYWVHPFLEHVPASHRQSGIDRSVFGTFLNRNHLAALFVVAILTGVGLFTNRQRILNHRAPGFLRRQYYIIALMALAGAGLVLTGSRGALVSLVAGALVLAALLLRPERENRGLLPILGLLALVASLPFVLPAELLERFLHVGRDLTSEHTRAGLWKSAFALFQLAPFVGHGLGTFGSLSVLTQPDAVVGHVEHAHSDPLELLAETGLIGLNLLLWCGLLLGIHVVRRCRRTRGDRRSGLAAAAFAAVCSVAVQSTVDFDFQVPALAGWCAILAGSASGAMATANGLPVRGVPVPRWLLAPCLVGLGLCAAFAAREAVSYHLLAGGGDPATAERIHPCRGEPARDIAWRAVIAEESPRDLARIRAAATRALQRNPFAVRPWHAVTLASIWDTGSDPTRLMRRTVELLPPSERPTRRIDLALALLLAGRTEQARSWLHELFTDPRIDGVGLLRRLHSDLGPRLELRELVPESARAILVRYAEELRLGGALRDREQILDLALHRAPAGNRWTLSDSVTLDGHSVLETDDEHGHRLHVTLQLQCPPDARIDGQMMCLHLLGRESVVEHYFRPRRGTATEVVTIPACTPPGRYDLALQPYTNGTRYGIGSVSIDPRGFHLTPGRAVTAADLLYRSAAPPGPPPPGPGLDLGAGIRLWRTLRLSEPGGALVLDTSRQAPVRVAFAGRELPLVSSDGNRHRYRLPARVTEGLFEVTATEPDRTVLLDVTLLREEPRR